MTNTNNTVVCILKSAQNIKYVWYPQTGWSLCFVYLWLEIAFFSYVSVGQTVIWKMYSPFNSEPWVWFLNLTHYNKSIFTFNCGYGSKWLTWLVRLCAHLALLISRPSTVVEHFDFSLLPSARYTICGQKQIKIHFIIWIGFKTGVRCQDWGRYKITYITHVGLEFSHTLVLWCVQDYTEVGKVLLGIDLIWFLDNNFKRKSWLVSKIIRMNHYEWNMTCMIREWIITLNLVISRIRVISGESGIKQPMPLSHCKSSLYFSCRRHTHS